MDGKPLTMTEAGCVYDRWYDDDRVPVRSGTTGRRQALPREQRDGLIATRKDGLDHTPLRYYYAP